MQCIAHLPWASINLAYNQTIQGLLSGDLNSGNTESERNGNIYLAWQPRFYNHIIRKAASFERMLN